MHCYFPRRINGLYHWSCQHIPIRIPLAPSNCRYRIGHSCGLLHKCRSAYSCRLLSMPDSNNPECGMLSSNLFLHYSLRCQSILPLVGDWMDDSKWWNNSVQLFLFLFHFPSIRTMCRSAFRLWYEILAVVVLELIIAVYVIIRKTYKNVLKTTWLYCRILI